MNLTDTYYPAEGKFHGYGTQIMVGDGASPEEFEAVAEVADIDFAPMQAAVFDRTHLRSPNAAREKMVGLKDVGVFTLLCNYRPKHESQNYTGGGSGSFTSGGMLRFYADRTTKTYKLVASDGSPATELEFEGAITNYKIGRFNVDGGTDLQIEIQPLNGSFISSLP